MTRKTLTIILDAFIVLLLITIVLLIVMIVQRGSAPIKEEQAAAAEPEVISYNSTAVTPQPTEAVEEQPAEEEEEVVFYCTPNTSSAMNIRSGAGTDHDKVGSAYAGEEYQVIDVLEEGWTIIDFKGREAYAFTEYLDFYSYETDADGNKTKKSVKASDIGISEQ